MRLKLWKPRNRRYWWYRYHHRFLWNFYKPGWFSQAFFYYYMDYPQNWQAGFHVIGVEWPRPITYRDQPLCPRCCNGFIRQHIRFDSGDCHIDYYSLDFICDWCGTNYGPPLPD